MELELVLTLNRIVMATGFASVAVAIASYGIYALAIVTGVLVLHYKIPKMKAGLSVIAATTISMGMSLLWYRPRPFITGNIPLLLQHVADSSFPSDHATVAFAFATLFWRRQRSIAIALGIAALCIGFARIVLGLHYPTDILGGFVVGIGTVEVIHKLWVKDNGKKRTAKK